MAKLPEGLGSPMLKFLEEEGKRRKKKKRPLVDQIEDEFGKQKTYSRRRHMRHLIKGHLKKVGLK